ncbi:GntR family transcriptional regulator [Nonomuraea sp. NPDC050790]|uniref:GntR family transcriptional regulator n=1 Tax=Nonomuraea sp. NPDC050790 TaxID=3364371 RepID=UPI0037B5911A
MIVDHHDPTPKYLQIARIIRDQIRAGELEPLDAIPSESRLVQIHGVARETARDAIKVLREEGWIYTIQARGSYVSPAANWPQEDSDRSRDVADTQGE